MQNLDYLTASPLASMRLAKTKSEGQNKFQTLLAAKSMPRGFLHRLSTSTLRNARTGAHHAKSPSSGGDRKKSVLGKIRGTTISTPHPPPSPQLLLLLCSHVTLRVLCR